MNTYTTDWPDHCTKCQGWGYHERKENGQTFRDECECVFKCCPRCGYNKPVARFKPGDYYCDEVVPVSCESCGFKLGKTDGYVPPDYTDPPISG
jgi:hypothetical protein